MQGDEDSEADSTLEVAPPMAQAVPWRVTSVEPLPAFRLRVCFADGTQGEVELGEFLASTRVNGTVFESLRDPALFAGASVAQGAVQWPNGADLAPDAMYDAIRSQGRWVISAES
jgi:hypothetical protein